ncbi:DUF998 domain-containing protein [Nonomuraea sp. ZG12]|uniref:DUF998 domain-containing protein n=1 Tax=Nonomuraea sp. ZG12 TaxID=3452207 RepID=UPI003F8C712E
MHRAARWGLGGVGAGATLILGLDLAALGELDPLRRTISEHGLREYGWVFGLGIALLAAGSAAIGVSLARRRMAGTAGTLALMAWSAGLLVIACFPKHDWSVGPSLSGSIHRAGSVVAFLSLPLAALIIARPWRRAERGAASLTAFVFGLLSVLFVLSMAAVMAIGAQSGLPWWRVMPIGLVERGLAVIEVAALTALGVWAAGQRLAGARVPAENGQPLVERSTAS